MPYARQHLSKRVRATPADVPVDPLARHRKKAMMTAGVAVSMVVIAALYAASFRYQHTGEAEAPPRWGVIKDGTIRQSNTLLDKWDQLIKTREALSAAIATQEVQARGVELLKEKIRNASGTPMTSNQ